MISILYIGIILLDEIRNRRIPLEELTKERIRSLYFRQVVNNIDLSSISKILKWSLSSTYLVDKPLNGKV